MTITKVLGIYILMYRRGLMYFTGKTQSEVIEKAFNYLASNK